MKRSSKILGIVLLILIYTIQIPIVKSQESRLISDVSYIVKFNVELMARKLLSNYELIRKEAKWNYGREYIYKMENGSDLLFVTVGIHASAEAANKIATNYLNEISMTMMRGLNNDASFGDNYWYASLPQDTSIVTNIMFVRKNALVIISSYNYLHLNILAKMIDEGIVNGESYVEKKGIMKLPDVKPLVFEKKITKENDNIKISLDSVNSANKAIEYQFLPGLAKLKKDPPNTFTLFSCSGLVKNHEDLVTVKMITIDEDNVVSQVSDIKVKIRHE